MPIDRIPSAGIESGGVAISNLSATGTPDSTTFLRGDNTWATPGGGFSNWQIFTSSGTFTVPTGITKVKATVVGGGGGSGGAQNSPSGAGGGGGAAIRIITGLTPGGTVAVTVGAGGTAGTAFPTVGGAGGTSSFGAYCSATGGAGGYRSIAVTNSAIGGLGSGGDLNLRGGSGFASGDGLGAPGGLSILGAPSSAQTAGSAAPAGNLYGGGASGHPVMCVSLAGAVGAAGIVIVEW